MKNKNFMIIVLVVLIIGITILSTKTSVQAANKKYSFVSDECSSFKKSNGRLTIKIEKNGYNGLRLNNKKINKRNIVLKLSKRCNWSYTPGGVIPYKRTSYKKIKKQISHEYNYRKKYGYYDSPSIVSLTIKKGKLVRVNISFF